MTRFFAALALAAALFLPAAAKAEDAVAHDPENVLYLDLKDGRVTILMHPEWAPKHVARIRELVRQGFYDGIVFHRVIDGFMAQTGDPTGTGMGGSGRNIQAEFNGVHFDRGILGMARASDPNSADSQFFICFRSARFLDGQYTAWAEVIDGMQYVDNITRGEPPANPDKIVSLRVAADVPPNPAPGVAESGAAEGGEGGHE
jgi:peptidylprolyl isomerase